MRPRQKYPYSVISVTLAGGAISSYRWCGDSDLVAIDPELVGTLDQIPWELEFVRDDVVPSGCGDTVLRKIYRRL